MRKPRPGSIRFVATCTLLFGMLCFVACQSQSPQVTSTAAAPPAAAAEKVSIVFEGPWAIAPDPDNAAKVLLIAPKTKSHLDLYVAASNNATLTAGVYELSVPVSGTPGTPTTASDMAEANTTAEDLKRVIGTKSDRYVIRLPKPEAYQAATRYRSRVGPTYPPDPSTEKDYVSSVSLRYSVSGMSGFSLSGTPDSGSFNPMQLQVEAGTIGFVVNPAQAFDPKEKCHVHSREAFRDLARLVKVKLYIDFPDSPASCHDTDPQKSKTAGIFRTSPTDQLRARLEGNTEQIEKASLVPDLRPALLLFGLRPPVCTGVIIILKTTTG
jgi:hypothetical protein